MSLPLKKEQPRPLRIVKQDERKVPPDAKVELGKIRRELLTLAARIDKVTQGQETA